MIVHAAEQGSPEWRAARLGVVTASEFNEVLTPGKLLPAKGDAYLARLVAETLLGAPVDEVSSDFMKRGTEMEPLARDHYAWTRSVTLERVGFITRDDGRVGASPDSLVGEDGGLEVKVPSAPVHVSYMLDPSRLADAYRGQVQGCLYITGRKWWDLMSWNPALPEVCVRVYPDPAYLAALAPALTAFLSRLDAALAALRPGVDAARDANPFA